MTAGPPPRGAFAGPPAPPGPEPEVDPTWSVLLDDPLFAVLAKSGNLPCHPSGRYREHTLDALLRAAGWPEVHFTSRLDRETSGAVVVAKTAAAAARLDRDMAARRFDKRYLCLVEGGWDEPAGPDGWFDAVGRIRPASDATVRKYRVFEPAPEPAAWREDAGSDTAHTRFRPLRSGGGYTLLECKPVTGRTAQIRATLYALGHPVAGDKLYGPDRTIYARLCAGTLTAADRARLVFPRQALHAWRVSFPHPATREPVAAEAPPPDFLRPAPGA